MSSLLAKSMIMNIARHIRDSFKLASPLIRHFNYEYKFQIDKCGPLMKRFAGIDLVEKSAKSYEQEIFEKKVLLTAQRLEQIRLEAIELERKCSSKRMADMLQEAPVISKPAPKVMLAATPVEKKIVKKPQPVRMSVPELPEMKMANNASATNMVWSRDN